MGGFQKWWGLFVGVLVIRIIISWGLCLGPQCMETLTYCPFKDSGSKDYIGI